jgi:type IV secretion system protein TrbL
VLLAFFILAIQLFVTLIEFKLTTLAGFVLIPFGLFGKSAFMAERVLGNVISSGIKVLVLAVIVGIGSTLFAQFTSATTGAPSIDDAMAMVLAALALLGLGIFGPGIANGLVSGGPQLGAGAAVGAAAAGGGVVAAGLAGAGMAGSGLAVAGGISAGAARGGAGLAGGTISAYSAGGVSGVAKTGVDAAMSPLRRAASSLKSSAEGGGQGATGEGSLAGADAASTSAASTAGNPPAWARRMKRAQTLSQGTSAAAHAVRSGDHGGSGSSVDLSEGK